MQSIQFVSMLQFVSTLLSDPKTFYSSSLFMVRFIKKIIINSFFMVTNNKANTKYEINLISFFHNTYILSKS